MSATNAKNLSVNPGIVEVALWTSAIPSLNDDMTNADVVKSAVDALSYSRIASVTDVKVTENRGDQKIEVKTDDNGTIYKATTPSITLGGNWYETGDYDVINKITGKKILNVAGTPVTVTDEAHGTGWTIGKPIMLLNKNGADTIVSSIVVKANSTTLTLGTDYQTYVGDGTNGAKGYTYIVPVTAQTLAIKVSYSYTPNAAKYIGGTIKPQTVPELVVRVTSTDPSNGKVQVTYLINAGFEAELVQGFVDVVRAGELPNSPFTFTGNNMGQILAYTNNL